jgi:hypothetical protein
VRFFQNFVVFVLFVVKKSSLEWANPEILQRRRHFGFAPFALFRGYSFRLSCRLLALFRLKPIGVTPI